MTDYAEDKGLRDALRKPFPPNLIGKLPATPKRPALDYVGHAAVTDRLNKLAPDWSYTVETVEAHEGRCWIRGTFTLGGVSRVEFGDGDDPKDAVGNFIRRGAMRFGVGLDLWSREELDYAEPSVSVGEGGPDTSAQPADAGNPRAGEATPNTSPAFPVDPTTCSHKTASGNWVRWIGEAGHEVCPKCGTPKLVAIEGTTADLGPAQ